MEEDMSGQMRIPTPMHMPDFCYPEADGVSGINTSLHLPRELTGDHVAAHKGHPVFQCSEDSAGGGDAHHGSQQLGFDTSPRCYQHALKTPNGGTLRYSLLSDMSLREPGDSPEDMSSLLKTSFTSPDISTLLKTSFTSPEPGTSYDMSMLLRSPDLLSGVDGFLDNRHNTSLYRKQQAHASDIPQYSPQFSSYTSYSQKDPVLTSSVHQMPPVRTSSHQNKRAVLYDEDSCDEDDFNEVADNFTDEDDSEDGNTNHDHRFLGKKKKFVQHAAPQILSQYPRPYRDVIVGDHLGCRDTENCSNETYESKRASAERVSLRGFSNNWIPKKGETIRLRRNKQGLIQRSQVIRGLGPGRGRSMLGRSRGQSLIRDVCEARANTSKTRHHKDPFAYSANYIPFAKGEDHIDDMRWPNLDQFGGFDGVQQRMQPLAPRRRPVQIVHATQATWRNHVPNNAKTHTQSLHPSTRYAGLVRTYESGSNVLCNKQPVRRNRSYKSALGGMHRSTSPSRFTGPDHELQFIREYQSKRSTKRIRDDKMFNSYDAGIRRMSESERQTTDSFTWAMDEIQNLKGQSLHGDSGDPLMVNGCIVRDLNDFVPTIDVETELVIDPRDVCLRDGDKVEDSDHIPLGKVKKKRKKDLAFSPEHIIERAWLQAGHRRGNKSKYQLLTHKLNNNQYIAKDLSRYSRSRPRLDEQGELRLEEEQEEEEEAQDDEEKNRFNDDDYVSSFIKQFQTNPRRYKVYPTATKFKKRVIPSDDSGSKPRNKSEKPRRSKHNYNRRKPLDDSSYPRPLPDIRSVLDLGPISGPDVQYELLQQSPGRCPILVRQLPLPSEQPTETQQQSNAAAESQSPEDEDLDNSFGDPADLVKNITRLSQLPGNIVEEQPSHNMEQENEITPPVIFLPASQINTNTQYKLLKQRKKLRGVTSGEEQVDKLLAYISDLNGEVKKMAGTSGILTPEKRPPPTQKKRKIPRNMKPLDLSKKTRRKRVNKKLKTENGGDSSTFTSPVQAGNTTSPIECPMSPVNDTDVGAMEEVVTSPGPHHAPWSRVTSPDVPLPCDQLAETEVMNTEFGTIIIAPLDDDSNIENIESSGETGNSQKTTHTSVRPGKERDESQWKKDAAYKPMVIRRKVITASGEIKYEEVPYNLISSIRKTPTPCPTDTSQDETCPSDDSSIDKVSKSYLKSITPEQIADNSKCATERLSGSSVENIDVNVGTLGELVKASVDLLQQPHADMVIPPKNFYVEVAAESNETVNSSSSTTTTKANGSKPSVEKDSTKKPNNSNIKNKNLSTAVKSSCKTITKTTRSASKVNRKEATPVKSKAMPKPASTKKAPSGRKRSRKQNLSAKNLRCAEIVEEFVKKSSGLREPDGAAHSAGGKSAKRGRVKRGRGRPPKTDPDKREVKKGRGKTIKKENESTKDTKNKKKTQSNPKKNAVATKKSEAPKIKLDFNQKTEDKTRGNNTLNSRQRRKSSCSMNLTDIFESLDMDNSLKTGARARWCKSRNNTQNNSPLDLSKKSSLLERPEMYSVSEEGVIGPSQVRKGAISTPLDLSVKKGKNKFLMAKREKEIQEIEAHQKKYKKRPQEQDPKETEPAQTARNLRQRYHQCLEVDPPNVRREKITKASHWFNYSSDEEDDKSSSGDESDCDDSNVNNNNNECDSSDSENEYIVLNVSDNDDEVYDYARSGVTTEEQVYKKTGDDGSVNVTVTHKVGAV